MKTKVEVIITTGKEVRKFKTDKYKHLLNFVNKELPKIIENQEWCNQNG